MLIGVEQICSAWTAYAGKRIKLVDLRAWFGCWELAARRCRLMPKRRARYQTDELHRLIGGAGGRHLGASLRRLENAGLLSWTSDKLDFCPVAAGTDNPELHRMMAEITNNRRRVPVPRRIVRLIAEGASRVLIATILAHLVRCLYARRTGCNARGTCKASWTADVFGVDVRNVKAARKHLVRLGWLIAGHAPQWRLNRFGAVMAINLDWGSSQLGQVEQKTSLHDSPPRTAPIGTRSPLPESDRKLLPEYKNQKPASGGPDGVVKEGGGEKPKHPPCWERLIAQDLHCPKRLLALFRQAVKRNLVSDSEAARLAFVAAAEHARMVARRNPCGLFRTVVERGLWGFVTQTAEDSARARLGSLIDTTAPQRAVLTTARPIGETVRGLLATIIGKGGSTESTHTKDCSIAGALCRMAG